MNILTEGPAVIVKSNLEKLFSQRIQKVIGEFTIFTNQLYIFL